MTIDTPPFTPDQLAAHDLLSELRTRIRTQSLPYQYGVEARTLESLFEIFGLSRKAVKDHPGCAEFVSRLTLPKTRAGSVGGSSRAAANKPQMRALTLCYLPPSVLLAQVFCGALSTIADPKLWDVLSTAT